MVMKWWIGNASFCTAIITYALLYTDFEIFCNVQRVYFSAGSSTFQSISNDLSRFIQLVQLMVQLLVQLNYIIISYLYIGPRCLSKFITFGSHFWPSVNVT